MVLVDRKTDWFQDEISLDIKKFAWNGTGINREIRDFVLAYFLIFGLLSSYDPSVNKYHHSFSIWMIWEFF